MPSNNRLQRPAEAKQSAKILPMLAKAAALYRRQIAQGLDGNEREALKARVILRELFGGRINLKREGKGELWGESALQPAALLAVGYRVAACAGTGVSLEARSKGGNAQPPRVRDLLFGPANLRVTFEDGKTTDSSVTEGEVVVRDPLTHVVENIGNTELHALLVELKRAKN